MNIEIGKKIKTLRLQKGMTQEELSAKLNMSFYKSCVILRFTE